MKTPKPRPAPKTPLPDRAARKPGGDMNMKAGAKLGKMVIAAPSRKK